MVIRTRTNSLLFIHCNSALQFLQSIWAEKGCDTVRGRCKKNSLLILFQPAMKCMVKKNKEIHIPLLWNIKIYMLLGISTHRVHQRTLYIREADKSKFSWNCTAQLAWGNVPSNRIGSLEKASNIILLGACNSMVTLKTFCSVEESKLQMLISQTPAI